MDSLAVARGANRASTRRRTRSETFVLLAGSDLDRAYRLAWLVLGDADAAEAAVRDALSNGWRSGDAPSDPATFRAWFDRMLMVGCRRRLRRSRAPGSAGPSWTLRPLDRDVLVLREGASLPEETTAGGRRRGGEALREAVAALPLENPVDRRRRGRGLVALGLLALATALDFVLLIAIGRPS